MFAIVFTVLAASMAVATAGDYKQPAQYPADVSPAACPNYPFCGPTPDGGAPQVAFKSAQDSSAENDKYSYAVVNTAAAQPVQQYSSNYLPYVYLALPAQQAQFYSAAAMPQQYYAYAAAPAAVAAAPAPKPAPVAVAPAPAPAAIPEVKYRKVDLAPEYPAGVDPAACPNFPFCGTNLSYARFRYEPVSADDNSAEAAAAAVAADKYPANFDSTKCIDYPFCTQTA